MKILKFPSTNNVSFCSLEKGTVFKTAENNAYYMKTEMVIDADGVVCNAMLLNDGTMMRFQGNDMVHIVDCELIIH